VPERAAVPEHYYGDHQQQHSSHHQYDDYHAQHGGFPSDGDYVSDSALAATAAASASYASSSSSNSSAQSPLPTRIEVDPYDVLAAALVPGALQRNDFKPERKRWYVLLVFAWLSAMQGIVWCCLSTVPESSNNFFGEPSHSQKFLDLVLNWGSGNQKIKKNQNQQLFTGGAY
jgi:hypothetical protein